MNQAHADNPVLTGPIIKTFFRHVIPSIVGLLAITTASIVDGIFVGNFVSAEGLAAINLLIPYLSLIFGLALMLSIGGAVRAGHYLGQRNHQAASSMFGQSLVTVIVVGIVFFIIALVFDRALLRLLGTPESLLPLILPYFHIISAVLIVQIATMVMYYFIRLDNGQTLATTALVTGAIINIILDALFIIVFDMGLIGAAIATALAQTVQILMLGRYWLRRDRVLQVRWHKRDLPQLRRIAFNGSSEFINEISGGLLILILNWLLVSQLGVAGISAFAVINYLIFVSLMLYYGISDALHLVVSQNHGARQPQRIACFVACSIVTVLFISVLLIYLMLYHPQQLSHLFLSNDVEHVAGLSEQFISLMWPLFLINGVNVVLSIYLTAMQQPLPSLLIAISRSLIMPAGLLLVFIQLLPSPDFLLALPLAEWLTFILALALFYLHRPSLLHKS